MNGIWALKPSLFGSLDPQGQATMLDIVQGLSYQMMAREASEWVVHGVVLITPEFII